MQTIALLTVSNIFMTIAWYGHLKYKDSPLWIVILASWGIAFVEHCFQVPANRIGQYECGATEDDTRSDYAGWLLRLFRVVPERASEMELPSGVCLNGRWRGRDL